MVRKVTSFSETQELVLEEGGGVVVGDFLNYSSDNPQYPPHHHLHHSLSLGTTSTTKESEEEAEEEVEERSSSASMVSYYNPAAVAMFSRPGAGGHHHHHHHTSPTPNHYFAPAYSSYHPHHNPHTVPPTSAVGVGVGVGVGMPSTQFSPNMAPDFNCNPQYNHPFGNSVGMTPTDSAAIAAAATAVGNWHHQPSVYSACHARNIVSQYEAMSEWPHSQHGHGHHGGGGHHHQSGSSAGSFYNHQQHSPSSSTPSPNPTQINNNNSSNHSNNHNSNNNNNSSVACAPNGNHSPSSNVYSNSSMTFKTEFGPCSGGNPQENASQEMQTQGPVVSSAGPSTGTPHSPDSGMAISDGVSSSGSPHATSGVVGVGGQQHVNCHSLGGHLNSSQSQSDLKYNPLVNGSMVGSQQNLNHQTALHGQRPTQARSPFEWMKKPSYSISSNTGGKTRTKDKYRVVYSDTQRLELEKEFHYNRYITIRRKAELASVLGLSERQVKIWFQNRRAKERKVVRKRDEVMNREKVNLHLVQVQNNLVANGMPHLTGPMCNQGNGNTIPMM